MSSDPGFRSPRSVPASRRFLRGVLNYGFAGLALMAVALLIPAAPFELAPMKVLLLAEAFEVPELYPTKVLLEPVVLFKPANFPKKEF